EMIDLYDLDDGRMEQRRVTLQRCREKIAKLSQQKADIESSISELKSFIAQVEATEHQP
ncbi:MAG: transcriptional regulator, partial [Oxalobacteraceae bacterium]